MGLNDIVIIILILSDVITQKFSTVALSPSLEVPRLTDKRNVGIQLFKRHASH